YCFRRFKRYDDFGGTPQMLEADNFGVLFQHENPSRTRLELAEQLGVEQA
ncbi:hypothetical protein EAI_15423, partial [Harpegnathos saltator]